MDPVTENVAAQGAGAASARQDGDGAGSFSAAAHDSQGVQLGDNGIMINVFAGGQVRAPGPAPAPAVPLDEGRWTPALSSALAYSLGAFPSMRDAGFRDLFLGRVRRELGGAGALGVTAQPDAGEHILAIVLACRDHEDPAAAVKALYSVMAEVDPGAAGLDLLQDCYWTVTGRTALSIERLRSVLDVIGPLSRECDRITAHSVAREAALDGEGLPLRAAEDLVGVLRRLNVAQVSASAPVPLVVRFLARLASRVGGTAGSRLDAEVEGILRELDLAGDVLNGPRPPAAPGDSARVLQIRLEETSSPGNPRYAIDAAVFETASGSRSRVMGWHSGEDCSLDDMTDVGGRFLERAGGLGWLVGDARDLMVEFLLPWSLLGQPVERWSLDSDGYWIGHAFPVVVRSLDRQRKESFHQSWRRRWELLSDANGSGPASRQIGWLHHGHGAVPEGADRAGRVVRLTGRNALTQWLEKDENYAIAALGLTFAYRPDDPVAVSGLKAAVHEGIPLLVWLRGTGDVSQLEGLLDQVNLRDLPGKVLKWRRQTADSAASTRDARYHVVLLWDDPADTVRPSERRFAAPR